MRHLPCHLCPNIPHLPCHLWPNMWHLPLHLCPNLRHLPYHLCPNIPHLPCHLCPNIPHLPCHLCPNMWHLPCHLCPNIPHLPWHLCFNIRHMPHHSWRNMRCLTRHPFGRDEESHDTPSQQAASCSQDLTEGMFVSTNNTLSHNQCNNRGCDTMQSKMISIESWLHNSSGYTKQNISQDFSITEEFIVYMTCHLYPTWPNFKCQERAG